MPQQTRASHDRRDLEEHSPRLVWGRSGTNYSPNPLTLICWAARYYHHHHGRGRTMGTEFVLERLMDTGAVCCKAVRSGARLICHRTPRQPSRGEYESRAPVHRRRPALPWASWTFSRSATMSTAKCRGAVAPALQTAPSLLASVDSQIIRRQRCPCHNGWGYPLAGICGDRYWGSGRPPYY
jgi:hypothetical protein